jgi:ADP-heptose:LPS heptosyltransferase
MVYFFPVTGTMLVHDKDACGHAIHSNHLKQSIIICIYKKKKENLAHNYMNAIPRTILKTNEKNSEALMDTLKKTRYDVKIDLQSILTLNIHFSIMKKKKMSYKGAH